MLISQIRLLVRSGFDYSNYWRANWGNPLLKSISILSILEISKKMDAPCLNLIIYFNKKLQHLQNHTYTNENLRSKGTKLNLVKSWVSLIFIDHIKQYKLNWWQTCHLGTTCFSLSVTYSKDGCTCTKFDVRPMNTWNTSVTDDHTYNKKS